MDRAARERRKPRRMLSIRAVIGTEQADAGDMADAVREPAVQLAAYRPVGAEQR